MNISELADEIINGYRIQRDTNLPDGTKVPQIFFDSDLAQLCEAADRIRQAFKGNNVGLCAIINGKSGRCSENCRYCAQSSHNKTGVTEYPFLDPNDIIKEGKHFAEKGIHRFAIVTAGRALTGEEFEKALTAYRILRKETNLGLCASMGLLTDNQFKQLKDSGVTRYHCNIETSKRNFPNICTTHTYEDKITRIKQAQKQGLSICSGGIIGMGEDWEDRFDMALSLAELGVDSIPINALTPIPGTPLEHQTMLSANDILRTVAIFRFVAPTADIRMAAGRCIIDNAGEAAFRSGSNSLITGDMLTTTGSSINTDIDMLKRMEFNINKMHITIINGPNINMLGIREPKIYGKETYQDLCRKITEYGEKNGIETEIYQSNHEGDLVDKIQSCYGKCDGIVINPAAYTHTSVAILDAVKAVGIPTVEVHISDVSKREDFRQVSYIRQACCKTITGHGTDGYIEAIEFLKEQLCK